MTNINRQWLLAKRPFDDLVQGLRGLQDYYPLPSAGDNWRSQKKHNPPCANNSRSIGFDGLASPNETVEKVGTDKTASKCIEETRTTVRF